MEKKLNAATKLISGLSREQKRWAEDTVTLEENKIKLLGDCLLSSSFLSYVGPFDFFFRKQMVYSHWYRLYIIYIYIKLYNKQTYYHPYLYIGTRT